MKSYPTDVVKGAPPPINEELLDWKLAGIRIRELREKQGMSMESLARKSGVNRTMICKYERLDRPVTVNSALCIGPALGTTAKHILFGAS